jgi:predicted  nucleic acid-binding Zn-ribbon protein
LSLWGDLGGAYVGSKDFKDKYGETEKILTNFLAIVQREQTKILLEDQSDALKKLEKQQKGLEKDNQNLKDDIVNWQKKIAKAEDDIKTNVKNQDDTKKKIEDQRKLVEEIQKKLNAMK